jgi:hypothetical protein
MRHASVIGLLVIVMAITASAQPTAEELEQQCLDVCDPAQESCPLHDVRCADQCSGATNTTIEKVTALAEAITNTTNDAHKAFYCTTMFIASGKHVAPTLSVPPERTTTLGYTMVVLEILGAIAVLLVIYYWWENPGCGTNVGKEGTPTDTEGVELVKSNKSSKRARSRNGR